MHPPQGTHIVLSATYTLYTAYFGSVEKRRPWRQSCRFLEAVEKLCIDGNLLVNAFVGMPMSQRVLEIPVENISLNTMIASRLK